MLYFLVHSMLSLTMIAPLHAMHIRVKWKITAGEWDDDGLYKSG